MNIVVIGFPAEIGAGLSASGNTSAAGRARRGWFRASGNALPNLPPARQFRSCPVPGHPQWHLAPRKMGWEGQTLGEICAQLTDPERNGGRSLDDLVHHIGRDPLVGWAWRQALAESLLQEHKSGPALWPRPGENRSGVSLTPRCIAVRRHNMALISHRPP
jgi:hypothetical protein